jgi:hypothetical protein
MRNLLYMSAFPFLLFLTLGAASQEGFSLAYQYGDIVIHTKLIKPLAVGPVKGFSISYTLPNSCGEAWRKYFNYPNYGISYHFKSYGNPNILGNSHSLTSFLQISFLPKRKVFDIGFVEYTGIGYFRKKYDPVSNPTNHAISSNMNIYADVRIYSRIRVNPIYMEYSLGLNHISNGLIKAPNLGINTMSNSIALGYELEEQVDQSLMTINKETFRHHHELWTFASSGKKAVFGVKEKNYYPLNVSLNYSYALTIINKIGIGLDFISDPSLTDYAKLCYNYEGNPSLNFRCGINLHNEFIFGKTGFYSCYGFYPGKSEYYISQRYYKVGLKYYLKNFFGVVFLRAVPLFRADVVELGIGYRIRTKG